MKKIIVYTHPDCLLKDNGPNHPEKKERLQVILKTIQDISFVDIEIKNAPLAVVDDIFLAHPVTHINNIFSLIPSSGLVGMEKEPYADTFLCPNSKNAILRSCGAGIEAANRLIIDNEKRIFCAIRPPGHHAETVRANGFCFVNNVAVAARYLQNKYKIKKIAIIDFDVHHGNGTQEIFYQDRTVAYGSVHEYPLFPGTGSEQEIGVGNVFNAPIIAGTDGKDFINIFEKKILLNIDKFKPEIILISAGFDAHKRDPLANINLESENYNQITKMIIEIANIHSQGRVISFLEGGYDLLALSESIKEHFLGLSEN
ncbi:MAG TPA: histone deacetylase family protein [Alphaproteobacteria bacterium]|nr:histone deacetylase family protein [Alphaproteobacteria bacterium]